ncbi:hypothetical protein [Tabrizicola sp.]|uniref:hypothetical protein n=1 Tax=Tabrizicola sp. TaxID=2005166 RepID=UPI003D2E232B
MTQRLTVYFIVEPPKYELMACYLAGSLRQQFGDTVALVGYCPDEKLPTVSKDVISVLAKLGCDVRPFKVAGRFTPDYPHGNKILATLEPRDTEFSAFFDSDVLCLRPNSVENIIKAGHVSLTPAASMSWGKGETWHLIYQTCGMPMPEGRVKLMRQKGDRERLPYFSSGLFSFPEHHRNSEGKSFPEVWMEIAQTIDKNEDIPGRRPYLDQISLPLAIQKSELAWNILPEEQHFILGGSLRGEPLPEGREIYTVHYRKWEILKEVGLAKQGKKMLQNQAGVRRIDQISKATQSETPAEV